MLQINTLLFPTDFSECAESAFEQAVRLARRFGATLHVLNVVMPHEADPNNPMNFFPLDEPRRPPLASEVGSPPVASLQDGRQIDGVRVVRAQMAEVSPAVAILDYADRHDVDLIVMSTHGRRGLDRLLVGSVAEEIVRLATCPVFIVHPQDAGEAPRHVERILVPVDFSEHARLSITYARELAAFYGARLLLLHIVEEVLIPPAYGIEPVMLTVPEVSDRSREALEALARDVAGADVPVEVHVQPGHPARDIAEVAAERQADLIVIATHGLTGLKRLLIGSVTEKVVRLASCPVFTVKSFGKSLLPPLAGEAATSRLEPGRPPARP